MSKPDAPTPPDPKKVPEAQTDPSVPTAIASTLLGQINEVGPRGSLNSSQSGSFKFTDPNSGMTYDMPQFTATTSLNPTGQAIQDANDEAAINLARTGAKQSARVGE